MPAYITQPAVQPYPPVTIPKAVIGRNNYSFGYGPDSVKAYAAVGIQAAISNFSITSNVVTFTVVMGAFQPPFTNGASLVVSGIASPFDYLNGTYTITTASSTTVVAPKTHADVASTPVVGTAVQSGSQLAEFAEALAAGPAPGLQFSVLAFAGQASQSPAITWETEFPSAPATVDIRLQGALRDVEAEYVDIDKSTNAAGEERTVAAGTWRANFLRIVNHATTGGSSPTVIAKFLI